MTDDTRSPVDYPADARPNPVLARWTRGGAVESVHRGAWCLVDPDGTVLDGAGNWDGAYYVRSSIKSLQAVPLLESGAAERFGFSDAELTLALSSHNGEPCHTETVRGTLQRLGLDERALACGVHPPSDARVRAALRDGGLEPGPLHNNCSGKHAGFLALAKHLGDPLERYLDPGSAAQQAVRRVLAELTETPEAQLVPALDGCSAPTYRVSLRGVATAFARITNPDGLGVERARHCRRMTASVAAHPELLAGSRRRIDTDLVRVSEGRWFPKVGAEAIYALGVVNEERALALKVDDGGWRGMHAVVVGLLGCLGLADAAQLEALEGWRSAQLRNHAGLEVGRVELSLGG